MKISRLLSCGFLCLTFYFSSASEAANHEKAEYSGGDEDIDEAYHAFGELHAEIAKFQAKAVSILYGDVLIEATSVYERVFFYLATLGVNESLIDVIRALTVEGKSLIVLLLTIIDSGCGGFEESLLEANDDLRDERFEDIPGDYVEFFERNEPIRVAYENLLPMINTTLVFLEEAALSSISDLEGQLVIDVHGDLQRGRSLMEDSLTEFGVAKIFYDSAVDASMDALYKVVRQIRLVHSSGRKYTIDKLH